VNLPAARLDRIARLHVLAAGLPGVAVHETTFDAPFAQVWGWLSDLERSVPAFDSDVASLVVLRRAPGHDGGERLLIRSRSGPTWLWLPAVFDVDLAPGWCWMASRPQTYVVGMAAEPDGDRTRFGHLEGLAFSVSRPWAVPLVPVLALSAWRHRRHIPRDVAAMARHVERAGG